VRDNLPQAWRVVGFVCGSHALENLCRDNRDMSGCAEIAACVLVLVALAEQSLH